MSQVPLNEWLDAIRNGFQEMMKVSLQLDISAQPAADPKSGSAAWIQMADSAEQLQVGLIMEQGDCRELTRLLFSLEKSDPVTEDDVIDALGEVMNMTAGSAKRSLSSRGNNLILGLPFFSPSFDLHFSSKKTDTAAIDVEVGGLTGQFVVVRGK